MPYRSKLRWSLPLTMDLLLAAAALCIGCDTPHQPAAPASPRPNRPLASSCGPGATSQIPPVGACGSNTPAVDPLIDDFEDGDLRSRVVDGRQSEWYVFTDDSDGCIELRIAPEASSALHARGQGFTAWGAAFGLSFQWDSAQSKNCIYDASAYAGVRFRARGDAPLRLALGTKASTFQSMGGSCPDNQGCYDQYGRALSLTAEWQTFEIDFCSLAQEGWGTPLDSFAPNELVHLNFFVRATRPFDVWVDDVEFVRHRSSDVSTCKAHCPLEQLPAGISYDPAETPKLGGAAGLSLFTFDQHTPDCGPLVRRYLTYVPEALTEPSGAPILLLLPGTSSDAESMHQFMTGTRFVELAKRDGFVVVYANGAPGSSTVAERPNGGRFSLNLTTASPVDDVEYLKLVVDDLVERGVVSGKNPLYLAGHSIGGGLALEAAMQNPQRYRGIAAIMPFDGVPPNAPQASKSYALDRVLFAFTRADPDLPTGYDSLLAPLASKWAAALGIALQEPTQQQLVDRVVEGKNYTGNNATALRTRDSHVKRLDYTDPHTGRAVRVLEFDRAGHFWPMQAPYEDDAILAKYGFRNQDLNMADEIWEFLHPTAAAGE